MSQSLTKKDLKEALKPLATKKELAGLATKKDLEALATKKDLGLLETKLDTNVARLDESIREMNFSLTQHLSRLEGKIDFIAQNAVTRKEMRNLVSQLKDQGLKLDESKIFEV